MLQNEGKILTSKMIIIHFTAVVWQLNCNIFEVCLYLEIGQSDIFIPSFPSHNTAYRFLTETILKHWSLTMLASSQGPETKEKNCAQPTRQSTLAVCVL